MLQTLIVISFAVLSLIGYAYCAMFWFKLWRRKRSGSAHALFLMSTSLSIVVALNIMRVVTRIATAELISNCPYEIAIWIMFFFNVFFNLAFAKGYFNWDGGNSDVSAR